MKTKKVLLLLGGNEGNVIENIKQALYLIEKRIGRVCTVSSYYSTKAWGPIAQPDFINVAIVCKTVFSAPQVLHKILDIEMNLGRKRTVKYGPRIMDIDIIFYKNEMINTKDLQVPHPLMHTRNFVLYPCAEITPNWIHPKLKKSVKQLLHQSKDNLDIKVIYAS